MGLLRSRLARPTTRPSATTSTSLDAALVMIRGALPDTSKVANTLIVEPRAAEAGLCRFMVAAVVAGPELMGTVPQPEPEPEPGGPVEPGGSVGPFELVRAKVPAPFPDALPGRDGPETSDGPTDEHAATVNSDKRHTADLRLRLTPITPRSSP